MAAETRERIVEAARAAFTARGYAGTAMAAIASDAGVTQGAVFHHFRGKAELFREVFVRLESELDRYARAASLEGRPMDAFLAGCRASMEFGQRPDFNRIVLVEGPLVLGDAEWRQVDAELGLATVIRGLRNIAGPERLSKAAARPIAVLVMGAINEAIFALARKEADVTIDGALDALRTMLSPWERAS